MSKGSHKRGEAVEHSYVTPVEIEEGGRLVSLERSINDLILYIRKTSGKGCCGFIIAVGILIPVSMIIMGIKFYELCPAEKNITRYLLIGGITALLQFTIRCFTKKFRSFLAVLTLFSLAWFIAGSVWIFSLYEPNHDENEAKDFCDERLYLFAFWMTVVQYILSTFIVVYLCVLCYLAIEIE